MIAHAQEAILQTDTIAWRPGFRIVSWCLSGQQPLTPFGTKFGAQTRRRKVGMLRTSPDGLLDVDRAHQTVLSDAERNGHKRRADHSARRIFRGSAEGRC